MKLLHEYGNFQILNSEESLRDQLLIIEKAGRVSYQSEVGPITLETAKRFVSKIITRNHESVIEHSSMTVLFTGVSRGFTHEIVRHRLASPTQESTRYVDYLKGSDEPDLRRFQMGAILPPHRDVEERFDLGDGRQMSPEEMLAETEKFYRALRTGGWLAEDARQILPTGLESDIVLTANFREWRHIFDLRTAKAAHWEIRGVMGKLLTRVQELVPAVFDDFVKAGDDKNGLPFYEMVKKRGN